MGLSSTIDYLVECCHLVLQHTSLLPHANPGVCSAEEMRKLREATVSQGIMLESLAAHLLLPGAPHTAPRTRLPTVDCKRSRQRASSVCPLPQGCSSASARPAWSG